MVVFDLKDDKYLSKKIQYLGICTVYRERTLKNSYSGTAVEISPTHIFTSMGIGVYGFSYN